MSQPQPELEEDTYGEAEALEYPSHTAATAGIRYLSLTHMYVEPREGRICGHIVEVEVYFFSTG